MVGLCSVLQERDKELEILKESAQRDSLELRVQFNNEISNSRKHAKYAEDKSVKLTGEISQRDAIIQDLR